MVEKERKPCPFTLTMESSYLEYKYLYKPINTRWNLEAFQVTRGGGDERNQGSVGRALGTCKYILAPHCFPHTQCKYYLILNLADNLGQSPAPCRHLGNVFCINEG